MWGEVTESRIEMRQTIVFCFTAEQTFYSVCSFIIETN
ncbi:hypothetical protein BOVA604_4614 [Bacteroides ovatus]|nr:hypothetical protein BOVA604_4614 [Bacteroides ovatus]